MIIDISRFIAQSDRELVDVQCSTCGKPLKNYRYAVKIGDHAECSPECFRLAPWRVERDRVNQKARSQARHAARMGRIIKTDCEVCGVSPVEGHHTDYSKPLEVRWLCIPHHQAQHDIETIDLMLRCGVEFLVSPEGLPTLEDFYREWKQVYDRDVARRMKKTKATTRAKRHPVTTKPKVGAKKTAAKKAKKGAK
jgi:hypothetical protein